LKIAFMLLHDFQFAGWTLDNFLGRYHFSKEYSRRLAERGHDVTLYILHQDATSIKTLELDGYRVKVFPTQFRFPPVPGFGYSHNLQVTKELSRDKPDVVHFNNYYLWSFPYVARWAKRNGVGVVCQYHGASDFLRPARKAFAPVFQGVGRYLVAKDAEIAYLTGSLGVPPEKVVKLPNVGVDAGLFKLSGKKSPEPSLLYVGRMPLRSRNLREKSPWLLLGMMAELVKSLPDASLHLVGDGPGIQVLKKAAEEKCIGRNVTFHGYIDNSLVPQLYSSSWVTFIPVQLDSIDPFWDGSLKESLACSTPVIGFNESVKDYSSSCQRLGYLIPPTPVAGAKILGEILGDQERLNEMGKRGREEILGCCSWDSVIEGLEKVYRSLL
jgi:glycosyltransferase involved in cell wall biosynthesis